jgi:hypothetical protein
MAAFKGVMKRYPSATRRFAAMLPFEGALLGWLLVTFLLCAPQPIFGANKKWTGNTSTDWGTNQNWTGGAPSAGDNAEFNGIFSS